MIVDRVFAVFFSPVGHTKEVTLRIAGKIAEAFGKEAVIDDFTLPGARKKEREYGPNDLVVFGTPTYAGRVPNKIIPEIKELFKGNGTPLIAVVTFGNRSYDSSLKELCLELGRNGFTAVSGGAFPTRHVMSEKLAIGRPDEEDLKKADELADRSVDKVKGLDDLSDAGIKLPGPEEPGPYYRPLKEDGTPADFLKETPITDMSLCVHCGRCAELCPMGSIDREDYISVKGICIKCHACVRLCPKGAKAFFNADLSSHVRMLEKTFERRAEPELFF